LGYALLENLPSLESDWLFQQMMERGKSMEEAPSEALPAAPLLN